MKIIITSPHGEYQAGNQYELPDEEALDLIDQQKAIMVEEKKQKKVKYGDG